MAESELRHLDLVSVYMHEPVLGAHGISLQLDESARGHMEGRVALDPNICTLNVWGDREGCTKRAFERRDVMATAMKTLDPQGHNRILWVVDVEGTSGVDIKLIEYPDALDPQRGFKPDDSMDREARNERVTVWYLSVTSGAGGTSVVPLFDAGLFAVPTTIDDPAATVQTRYGPAIFAVEQRGDINEMRAEAEVVRNALAELEAHPELGGQPGLSASHIADVHAALAELDDALGKLKG